MKINLHKEYRIQLLKIAFPIIISNLISQVQMLIDKMFLGRLDITRMSAVSNASSPMWTTMNVIFSLTVGGTILMSQAVGAGEKERAQKIMDSIFKYSSVISLVLFLFWLFCPRYVFLAMGVPANVIEMSIDYARWYSPAFLITGYGAAVSSMLQVCERTGVMITYGIVRSLANVFLDWVMIFGNLGCPRMEVKGASLATAIADFIGIIIVIVYVQYGKGLYLKPRFSDVLKAKFSFYFETIKMGLPAALEEFAWNFGSLYLIVMLNRISDSAAGIYSIVFSIELLPICAIGSIGNAALTVSGLETGRKNYRGVRDVASVGIRLCTYISVLMLALFLTIPHQLMSIFTTDKAVIAASVAYLAVVGVDLFPKSGNIVIGSSIKGYGDTRWMLFTQIFGTMFIIAGSSLLVLGLHLGITQIFILVVADEALRCIINYFHLRKVTRLENA